MEGVAKKGPTAAAPPVDALAPTTGTDTLLMVLDVPSITEVPYNIPQELIDSCRKGDVLLVCAGNRAVQCHSQILMLASSVLEELLGNTDVCKGGSADSPAKLPVLADKAEDWLQALLHLYPLSEDSPDLTAQPAMVLALLGHKYNMPRLAKKAERFSSNIACTHENIWHGRKTFSVSELVNDSIERPQPMQVRAGGYHWKLKVYPAKVQGSTQIGGVSVFLEKVNDHGLAKPDAVVDYKVALVSQEQPGKLTKIEQDQNRRFTAQVPTNEWGWSKFISVEELCNPEKGYIKDGKVQFELLIKLPKGRFGDGTDASQGSASRSKPWVLSSDPANEFYVFNWLHVAQKVDNLQLQKTCIDFVCCNAFQVLFDTTFRVDLLEAMKGMTIDQSLMVLRSGACREYL